MMDGSVDCVAKIDRRALEHYTRGALAPQSGSA